TRSQNAEKPYSTGTSRVRFDFFLFLTFQAASFVTSSPHTRVSAPPSDRLERTRWRIQCSWESNPTCKLQLQLKVRLTRRRFHAAAYFPHKRMLGLTRLAIASKKPSPAPGTPVLFLEWWRAARPPTPKA